MEGAMEQKAIEDQNGAENVAFGDNGGEEQKEERRRVGDEAVDKENKLPPLQPQREEIKVPDNNSNGSNNHQNNVVGGSADARIPIPVTHWYRYLWVDAKDTENNWLEAQVMNIDFSQEAVRIHYKGYPPKWDEWISMRSDRLCQLHSKTIRPTLHRLQLPPMKDGLQLNVYDSVDQWGLAEVLQTDFQHRIIQVHYVQWSAKYDEWINMDSYRLAPLNTMVVPKQRKQPEAPKNALLMNEKKFVNELNDKGILYLQDMAADGNCLFRSVSHQVYGTPEHHFVVRKRCMEYMESQAQYFKVFVDDEDFASYIARMKYEGQWGGEPEIRAMGEIYQRPVEIYVYSLVPRLCYPGPNPKAYPIRLSYHWNSHYMSLINPQNHRNRVGFLNSEPGQYEDGAIRNSARLAENDSQEMTMLRAALGESRRQMDRDFNSTISRLIEESDIEEVKRASMETDVEKAVLEQVKQVSMDANMELEIAKKLSAEEFEKKQLQEAGVVCEFAEPHNLPGPVKLLLSMGYDPTQVEVAYAALHDSNTTEEIETANMVVYLDELRR